MYKSIKQLKKLADSNITILQCINEVTNLRNSITDDDEYVLFVNTTREIVQSEAVRAVIKNNGRGIVVMATGAGKSKVGVDLIKYYAKQKDAKFYDCNMLIVPTEKLRDKNWKEEFTKWKAKAHFDKLEKLCYASASKYSDFDINMVILDEGHNLTPLSSEIFTNNNVERAVVLTATLPTKDEVKKEMFETLALPVVYELTLEQAVQLGFVSPFEINVVYGELNNYDKYIQAGNKTKVFFQTELQRYNYLSDLCDMTNSKTAILSRMRFIYNLRSKSNIAKFILENVIPKQERTLIFCGNTNQSELLSDAFYHSKSGDKHYNQFINKEINRLSCVKAINEGHNLPDVDSALVVQINSNEKDIIQRIGRIIRFKLNHVGKVWIIVMRKTQDEVWANNALSNFDESRIKRHNLSDLVKEYGN